MLIWLNYLQRLLIGLHCLNVTSVHLGGSWMYFELLGAASVRLILVMAMFVLVQRQTLLQQVCYPTHKYSIFDCFGELTVCVIC